MWNNIKILIHQIIYVSKNWLKTIKGQLPEYKIMMESHRLEKGLLHKTPKPNWGWEKAESLGVLIETCQDRFACDTAKGVLNAYLDRKKLVPEEVDLVDAFIKKHPNILEKAPSGGMQTIRHKDICFVDEERELIEKFFRTRHSAREFSSVLVDKADLNKAIELALQCPSACNRQPTHIYVYQNKEIQTMCLAVDVRAYETGEFNDWIVSPSIFAGYLTLSLHLYGIGSCVMRKPLYGKSDYKKMMYEKAGLPENEMVIIEIVFGYYKEEFSAAVSRRHNVDEIVKIKIGD